MSAVMHVAVVGYVARLMWVGGVWDIARSFLDAKFAAPCGAFPHQEYVVFSSNIVYGNSMAGGGFHVRGGMIGGTHLVRGSNRAGFNKTRILSMIAPNKPDIAILDFGDSVVGPGEYKLFRVGAKGAGIVARGSMLDARRSWLDARGVVERARGVGDSGMELAALAPSLTPRFVLPSAFFHLRHSSLHEQNDQTQVL
jgi:hypothetical protein